MRFIIFILFCLSTTHFVFGKKFCDVCIGFLTKVVAAMPKEDASDQTKIEAKVKSICAASAEKDHRFCYAIGGLPESSPFVVNEVTKPLSGSMPPEKVCQRLQEKDSQICDLEYDKTVDINELKVKDLLMDEQDRTKQKRDTETKTDPEFTPDGTWFQRLPYQGCKDKK